MKSGFKTSEFYVALTGVGGLVLLFLQQHCSVSPMDVLSFVGVVVTYIVGRSWVKGKAAQGGQQI